MRRKNSINFMRHTAPSDKDMEARSKSRGAPCGAVDAERCPAKLRRLLSMPYFTRYDFDPLT